MYPEPFNQAHLSATDKNEVHPGILKKRYQIIGLGVVFPPVKSGAIHHSESSGSLQLLCGGVNTEAGLKFLTFSMPLKNIHSSE